MRSIIENNYFSESGRDGELAVHSFDVREQQIKPLPEWFSQMESAGEKTVVFAEK